MRIKRREESETSIGTLNTMRNSVRIMLAFWSLIFWTLRKATGHLLVAQAHSITIAQMPEVRQPPPLGARGLDGTFSFLNALLTYSVLGS